MYICCLIIFFQNVVLLFCISIFFLHNTFPRLFFFTIFFLYYFCIFCVCVLTIFLYFFVFVFVLFYYFFVLFSFEYNYCYILYENIRKLYFEKILNILVLLNIVFQNYINIHSKLNNFSTFT